VTHLQIVHQHRPEQPVIVVGTDGSPTATEAVRRAAEIARSRGGRLWIVTAIAPTRKGVDTTGLPDEFRTIVESPGLTADNILQHAMRGPAAGLDVETHAEAGDIVDVLLDVAGRERAELIVVGNRRRRFAQSVASRLSTRSHTDVLVVDTSAAAA
jgi:nucleotide-binding universal stress UspA family protein